MKELITVSKHSDEVKALCEKDVLFSYAVNYIGDLQYYIREDEFTHFVDTIIGQMLSNKVADVISKRLRFLCNNEITPTSVYNLSIQQLRTIGLSNAKAEYIHSFSDYVIMHPNLFEQLSLESDEEIKKRLCAIKGIGIWSANMYLIFVLNRPNVLPTEDGAFAQAVKWLYGIEDTTRERKSLKTYFSYWSPNCSLASRYMYKLLDSGITKTDRELFVQFQGNFPKSIQ